MINSTSAMNVLGIDTSTGTSGAVVIRDGATLAVREIEGGPSHSRHLLPMVLDALDEAGLRLADLDAIAVGTGPGSFTGIRVGLATANGLGWALGRVVVGISSLEAVAASAVSARGGGVVALMDARRGELFGARFAQYSGRLEADGEALCASPATVIESLVRPGDRVVGDGVERYRGDLLELAPGCEVVRSETPIALEVARLASPRVGPSRSGGHQRAVWPTYLREPHIRKAGQPR